MSLTLRVRCRTRARGLRLAWVPQGPDDVPALAHVGWHTSRFALAQTRVGCIDFSKVRWIPTRIGETDRCRNGVPSKVPVLGAQIASFRSDLTFSAIPKNLTGIIEQTSRPAKRSSRRFGTADGPCGQNTEPNANVCDDGEKLWMQQPVPFSAEVDSRIICPDAANRRRPPQPRTGRCQDR